MNKILEENFDNSKNKGANHRSTDFGHQSGLWGFTSASKQQEFQR